MKTIGVIGHFGFGKNLLDGQTIKTKIVTSELVKQVGSKQIKKVDTHGGLKTYIKLPVFILQLLIKCKNIAIFPAQNGVLYIIPLLVTLNVFFRRGLHYIVIGGWLPELVAKKPILKYFLKCFDGIYVETSTMKLALSKIGLNNVWIMKNCKNLKILEKEELQTPLSEPLKLCIFSRIMREKGIEDAIDAVRTINENERRQVYQLDIYGQIDQNQTDWFELLRQQFPPYIFYRGFVPYTEGSQVLKNYFALLFPTRFYTEGIPGTIVDSYAAGVPVICSKWENYLDVVDDNSTGCCYPFGKVAQLISLLDSIWKNPSKINAMKTACIRKAHEYLPYNNVKVLVDHLR